MIQDIIEFIRNAPGAVWCRSIHRRHGWWRYTRFYGGWHTCLKCARVWESA